MSITRCSLYVQRLWIVVLDDLIHNLVVRYRRTGLSFWVVSIILCYFCNEEHYIIAQVYLLTWYTTQSRTLTDDFLSYEFYVQIILCFCNYVFTLSQLYNFQQWILANEMYNCIWRLLVYG